MVQDDFFGIYKCFKRANRHFKKGICDCKFAYKCAASFKLEKRLNELLKKLKGD